MSPSLWQYIQTNHLIRATPPNYVLNLLGVKRENSVDYKSLHVVDHHHPIPKVVGSSTLAIAPDQSKTIPRHTRGRFILSVWFTAARGTAICRDSPTLVVPRPFSRGENNRFLLVKKAIDFRSISVGGMMNTLRVHQGRGDVRRPGLDPRQWGMDLVDDTYLYVTVNGRRGLTSAIYQCICIYFQFIKVEAEICGLVSSYQPIPENFFL